jgi:hypothetical protein
MYTLAILAFMGLALFKLVDLIEDLLPGLTRFHTLLTVVIGIGATVWFDYSMTSGFNATFRRDWMGTWLTGLAVAGVSSAWRALFHWLGSTEGDAPELRHPFRQRPKIAA